ncbi:AIM24 family protein [Risungbinella massiliensis]|uniref:AIM24 family protein n=1 Tax=Risungbinella massiliensis TaxID=1329796 RepID=UPI000699EAC1|nr:AIM24 family protein [Risungbinella massiliensis]
MNSTFGNPFQQPPNNQPSQNTSNAPFRVIDSAQGATASFEILEYAPLQAGQYYFQQRAGGRLKQVRIVMNNGKVIMEAGALQFLKGHIQSQNDVGGVSGLMGKLAGSMLNNESAFKPSYVGTGEIYLEPSFEHYLVYHLQNEEIIVDKGMFFACEATVEVGTAMQKSISSALKGGEGLFQTKLSGTGIAIMKSPVPANEIMKLQLNNERVQVDGNFALLRTGGISFTVERSAKSLLGSATSGEGYLQTFSGTGTLWIAPTEPIYFPAPTV